MWPSVGKEVAQHNAMGKVRQILRERGFCRTALAIAEAIFQPVLRLRRRCVFLAHLDRVREPSKWTDDEHLLVVDSGNLQELPPQVAAFLQSDDQRGDLLGIQDGNRLFLVTDGVECLHRGYVRMGSASGGDRKAVFFRGLEAIPEIRSCETIERARGRGLYRRVINEQFRYLALFGYDRAVLYTMGENVASMKGATAAGFQLYRTLHDWILFRFVVLQRVQEAGRTWWRVFLQ